MSVNLPSRQLSLSASMHLQSTHPTISSSQLTQSFSLLALSQPSQCRIVRHFRTSSSSQKIPSLRHTPDTLQQNQASLKSSSQMKPHNSPRSSSMDGKKSPRPEQVGMDIQKRAEAAAARARAQITEQQQMAPKTGSLADNSLFADQLQQSQRTQKLEDTMVPGRRERQALDPAALELRNPSHLAAALNPKPVARSMWQRRMVIRSVRQRGRLTKTVRFARTERSSLSKSHFFKTSMKKLAPLARQIAGKPIDEAILQMRFSKKKVAKEVREHLIQAKDQAIVGRGMGLGHLEQDNQSPPQPTSTTFPLTTVTTTTAQAPYSAVNPKPTYLPGTTIPTNPALRSPTDIYISQAWINRGPYGEKPDYRAFGRLNIMRPPHTGISVLLKEEKTRAREAREKETKKIRRRMGKNMWTQLPDRKITRQGQYLLW